MIEKQKEKKNDQYCSSSSSRSERNNIIKAILIRCHHRIDQLIHFLAILETDL